MKKSCLEQSTKFSDYLTVKTCWPNNSVKDCPKQIILSEMNSNYCLPYARHCTLLRKWLKNGEGITSQCLFAEGAADSTTNDAETLNLVPNYGKVMKVVVNSKKISQS